MVFSSLTFLLLFLPVTLALYFIVPQKYRNLILFITSIIFYAWGEPIYVLLILFSTLLDFICGKNVDRTRGTSKAKLWLLTSVIVNLSLLFFFKYTDFLINTINSLFNSSIPLLNLALPIGISFYTFQTMSYTIDVYRGDAKMQPSFVSFGAYVSMFPQLIAGPIVRYQSIAEELNIRSTSFDLFGEGIKRFIIGLGKKVLLANNIGLLWETVSSGSISELSSVSAWIGIIAFILQYYFDFSGYSDMAIGLGKMLGFHFPENFNYPFISKNLTEFWKRWHISLGKWFRDYIYIPLGGSRKGSVIQLRNIFIIWFLTGLWHGASWNYVLWGIYLGITLIAEKYVLKKFLNKIPVFFSHIYTLLVIIFGNVIFAFENLSDGWQYFKTMLGLNGNIFDSNDLCLITSYGILFAVCIICSTPLIKNIYLKLNKKLTVLSGTVIDLTGLGIIMFLCVIYLVSGSYNPFLYFRF